MFVRSVLFAIQVLAWRTSTRLGTSLARHQSGYEAVLSGGIETNPRVPKRPASRRAASRWPALFTQGELALCGSASTDGTAPDVHFGVDQSARYSPEYERSQSVLNERVAVAKPARTLREMREPTDPLRHAQYLARTIRDNRIDPTTRVATVRALCADLVASLSQSG